MYRMVRMLFNKCWKYIIMVDNFSNFTNERHLPKQKTKKFIELIFMSLFSFSISSFYFHDVIQSECITIIDILYFYY